ncbi:MAG: hypothetical protein GY810_00505 [Aureispira sp.]|nr:hypothetical protein [Aureispira sp.]
MKQVLYLATAVALALLAFSCKKHKKVDDVFTEASNNEEKWCFAYVPDMICRGGTETGIGIRLNNSSNKILIYLEGGGGCFNKTTCTVNPSFYNKTSFDAIKGIELGMGIFKKSNDNNPFKDWNCIYVPYCTGDVHSGTRTNVDIGWGIVRQQMVGHNNVSLVLAELVKQFPDADEVFLTGSSAGGYGTLVNADQVIEAFPDAKVTIMDDSGPIIIDETAHPRCLDSIWETTFGFRIPNDYSTYTTTQYTTDFKSIYEYLSKKHPDVEFGLVTYLEDLVIREFYGYGSQNCKTTEGIPAPVSGAAYKNGLIHLRDSVMQSLPNWKTYYIKGVGHTLNVVGGAINTLEVDDVAFSDWINQLRDRTATHVAD